MDFINEESNRISGKLLDKETWDKLAPYGNEMIITKSGRRMFPVLRLNLAGLNSGYYYDIFIEFNSLDPYRYKYCSSKGWVRAGPEDSQTSRLMCKHPDSPNKGEFWMSHEVSFKFIKLTNTFAAPPGQVVLTSMHKYQPIIKVVKLPNPSANYPFYPSAMVVKSIAFPETNFIAVTAYQNSIITTTKIDHNPFAKGFREGGKARKKKNKKSRSILKSVAKVLAQDMEVQVITTETEDSDGNATDASISPCLSSSSTYRATPHHTTYLADIMYPNYYDSHLGINSYNVVMPYEYDRSYYYHQRYNLSQVTRYSPYEHNRGIVMPVRLTSVYRPNTVENSSRRYKDFTIATILNDLDS